MRMNWQNIVQLLWGNSQGTIDTAYEHVNLMRKQITLAVLLGCAHFVVLVAVHATIQTKLFSVANSLWGGIWVAVLIIGLVMRGGWPVFGLVVTDAAGKTGHEDAHTIVRILIGFVTIETFVNIFFAILPFHAAWPMFLFLPSALGCYFLVRIMAGLPINWANWVIFPLTNIFVALVSIVYQGRDEYRQMIPTGVFGWMSGIGGTSFDFETVIKWGIICGIVLLVLGFVRSLFRGKTATTAVAPVTKEHQQ